MELTLDSATQRYQIRAYTPGSLFLNTEELRTSVILTPQQLQVWAPEDWAGLEAGHLSALLDYKFQVLILGTGSTQHFPPAHWLVPFYEAQLGIEIMSTAAACRSFNLLAAEGRQVVAALLIR